MSIYYRFLAELGPDDLIITANRRLSSHLQSQFDQIQATQKQSWLSPRILPLSQWFSELWAQSHPAELLLDNGLSRFLWQDIVSTESRHTPLLDTVRAAELAQQAWQLLHQWNIPLSRLNQEESEDVRAFMHWARCFQQRCQEQGWCDVSVLSERLLPPLLSSLAQLPRQITLVGFDSFPPAISTFFDALSARIKIIIPSHSSPALNKQRLQLTDRQAEFRTMAQWAKHEWQKNPQQSIACLIPELLAERSTVERCFADEFREDLATAVNIAGGYPLLNYPIIQTALTLLNLMNDSSLTRPRLTALLLSPFIRGAEIEYQERALLDRHLRQCREDRFTLSSLIVSTKAVQHCPQLLSLLSEAQSLFSQHQKLAYPSQWAAVFAAILTHFGWPGDPSLNSNEFQLVNSFQQQLRSYAGLDWLLEHQSIAEAFETLRQLLSKALFQAESEHNTPIQVLGILEASGLHFDQLWISNMNDDTWPRPPSPNPFLPIHLQRELSMPRSSGSHELHYAQQIMQRCEHATTKLITSYSLQNQEENRELSPSPLILDFTEISLNDLDLKMIEPRTANPRLEPWQDDLAPALKPDEKVRGGATVLKRQAECPFWAFAEIRLQAKPFDELELGLSAAERGSLVHAVLAELWRRLGDSEHLHRLDNEALNQLVKDTVTAVVNKELQTDSGLSDHDIASPLRDLEIQRLQQLVLQWLDIEKKRSPFKVSAIEQPFSLTVGDLSLRLQVDRIDTLEDGSQIIIDYKTGSPSPSSWLGERPEEPQLPLYALQDPLHVRGLAFAQIRTQSVKFNGITAQAGQLPGVKPSPTEWSVLVEQWQSALTTLADNFCAGEAAVTPKKLPTTCAYCHLASICRIHEREIV